MSEGTYDEMVCAIYDSKKDTSNSKAPINFECYLKDKEKWTNKKKLQEILDFIEKLKYHGVLNIMMYNQSMPKLPENFYGFICPW